MGGPRSLNVWKMGRVQYKKALGLQEALVRQRKAGEITDTILSLQHPPTYTLGKRRTVHHLLLPPADLLLSTGAELHYTERGGDVTFHGPSQAVLYPILSLRGIGLGVRIYVEKLQSAMVELASLYGVKARIGGPGEPGAWVGDRKLGAVGVRVSSGITSHGLALNIDPDMEYFEHIVPCGIVGKEVTSLRKETTAVLPREDDIQEQLVSGLAAVLGFTRLVWKDGCILEARKLTVIMRTFVNMASKRYLIQVLYDLCKERLTPEGISPGSAWPHIIQKFCSTMDHIGPPDVGLKDEITEDDRGHGWGRLRAFQRGAQWAQPITYLDIFECDSFTICVFCLPTSSVIPLHDHPGMTVFSKVLYGSLHVKAYDWIESASIRKSTSHGRLAKVVADKVVTSECSTSVLYAECGGNLHCFTAITPCAVLDVLTPPYREDVGRRCTYYHDYPFSPPSHECEDLRIMEERAWLQKITTPDDLYMRQGKYTGPPIIR